MPFSEDLSVFFGSSEFAREFTVTRPSGDVAFRALFDAPDELALDSLSIAADYSILYPTEAVSLRDGETLVDGGGHGIPAGTRWRVRGNAVRTNDGRTSTAKLSRLS